MKAGAWTRTGARPLAALLIAAAIVGCAGPAAGPSATLTVFAAASLADAFEAAGRAFSLANPDVTVEFNFGASDQLARQILAGAPADVFASANNTQMQVVVDSGLVPADAVHVFVHNRLVLVTPADNPAGIAGLADLARPGLHLVLAAPEVPAGRYALEALHNASAEAALGAEFEAAVQANVVSFEENVRAVLAKVTLGEADAGVVYQSDALSAGDQVIAFEIPAEWNVVANYPIAPLSGNGPAQAFIDYLLSPAGQALLVEYGFDPAGP